MDGLELLKKDWNKKNQYNRFNSKELYLMIHKKSSSIVRWILLISIIEFLSWGILSLFINDEEYKKVIKQYGNFEDLMFYLNIIYYSIIILFIYLFYRNYKTINTTDSTQKLIKSIVKTRNTVKYYVLTNLVIIAFILITFFIYFIKYEDSLIQLNDSNPKADLNLLIISFIFIGFILIIISLFWVFYKIIYGRLVKKLTINLKNLNNI